jgi:hypothetical protein
VKLGLGPLGDGGGIGPCKRSNGGFGGGRSHRVELSQCSENTPVRPYSGADSACYSECMCASADSAFTRGAPGLNDASAPS